MIPTSLPSVFKVFYLIKQERHLFYQVSFVCLSKTLFTFNLAFNSLARTYDHNKRHQFNIIDVFNVINRCCSESHDKYPLMCLFVLN